MFGRNNAPTTNFNINQSQPNLIQRAVKFEPIKLNAAMFFKIIGGGILLVVAWWFLRNKLTFLSAKKVYYPEIQPIQGGGDITKAFLSQIPAIVQMMQAAIKGVGFQSYYDDSVCKMFERLTNLKPNELIAVINSFNKNNPVDFKTSVISIKSGCGLLSDDYKEKLLYKFRQFNI